MGAHGTHRLSRHSYYWYVYVARSTYFVLYAYCVSTVSAVLTTCLLCSTAAVFVGSSVLTCVKRRVWGYMPIGGQSYSHVIHAVDSVGIEALPHV
jgi:hypothetical protein